MVETSLETVRKVSVVAATIVSLACGTNYIYSAWAPQFATRMHLSSTETNLIGVFGNLGMYASGIPVGLLVDSKGPRPGALIGAMMIGVGYFGMHKAYLGGRGSVGLPLLCLYMFLTGSGSACAFAGAIKTSAMNWPHHRGTATAFPLAAFGLSAFFFSTISTFAFPNNTSSFLLMLSIGTLSMIVLSQFFLRLVPNSVSYTALSTSSRGRSNSNPLHRTKSGDSRRGVGHVTPEPGTQIDALNSRARQHLNPNDDTHTEAPEVPNMGTDETSSLLSNTSAPGDVDPDGLKVDAAAHHSPHIDIRGIAMLRTVEFYMLFFLLGLMTGIGLMTINNIGNDAQALWAHWDPNTDRDAIQKRQLMHVSLLSIFSFLGRLLSGIGSDLIVKKLHMSRYWCLFISSCIFCAAQICGSLLENPHFLIFLSSLTGLAYGFLFGVYPSIIAETFGVNGLSQNWGWMTLAPVIFGNIFNLLYGRIYDHHSVIKDGHRECSDGRFCYSAAYWVTFGAGAMALVVSLWSIRYHHVARVKALKKEREDAAREE